MMRRAPARAVLILLVLAAVGLVPTVRAAAAGPVLQSSGSSVALGETVVLTLDGWADTVTVAVCGNQARRGAVDCDQTGAVAVAASPREPERRALTIGRPPVPCPCVLRAATPGEVHVVTTPIEIRNVPSAPLVGSAADLHPLRARAALGAGSTSFFGRARASIGGRSERTLVLTITNEGTEPLTGITLSAAVGRGTQGGTTLQAPDVEPLQPGESRPYSIPVTLDAPAFGDYVVYGTVYGAGTPVGFTAPTHNTPWGLAVLSIALVADVAAIAVIRRRRRLVSPVGTASEHQGNRS